ncbi:MAG TPA: hypothetical protein VGE26_08170 [Sphingobacteriaceae bacterium]
MTTTIVLAIISVLLSMIAYFLKSLHLDFKKMEEDMEELKVGSRLIRSETRSAHDLLAQQTRFLEQRVEHLEQVSISKDKRQRIKAAT